INQRAASRHRVRAGGCQTMTGRSNPEPAELGDFSMTPRSIGIAGLAAVIGLVSAWIALALLKLIAFFTNLFFFHRWSTAAASPADAHLGPWVVLVPVVGA